MLITMLPPDSGTVKRGTNLAAVLLDQRREMLDPEPTPASSLTVGACDTSIAGQSRDVESCMENRLFRPEQARTRSARRRDDELTAAEDQWLTLALRREEIKAV